jgi:membrane dipeptidase
MMLFFACTSIEVPAEAPAPASTPVSTPLPAPTPAPVLIRADLHLDTPTQLYRKKVDINSPALEASQPALQKAGINLAVEVLWPPRESDWFVMVDRLFSLVEATDISEESLVLVCSPAEARAAARKSQIGMLVNIEGAHGVEGVVGLQKLYQRGLRMLGLTWSFSNRFAGSSGDNGGGLTEEGKALVGEANRLGIILDLSHASRKATLEACQLSTKPVIASHSNAYSIYANARNLQDAEIQCICSKGGVIGLNLHTPFLGGTQDAVQASKHLNHIRTIGGAACVALGSDFDGLIKVPTDIPSSAELGKISTLLQAQGWTDLELQGFEGENFMRVWEQVTVP